MATSHKIDRDACFIFLGDTPADMKFVNALEYILALDYMSLNCVVGYAHDTTPQLNFLKEILENCNNLLTTLKPLKRNESQLKLCEDIPTANLIRTSFRRLNSKKSKKHDALLYDNFCTFPSRLNYASEKLEEVIDILELNTYEIIPEDYPNAVVESIEELRDAVAHAIDQTIPKLGRIDYRTPHFNRKTKLGCEFVEAYLMCYGKFPPRSINNPVYNVFVQLLYAANLAAEVEENCYKNAIDAIKNTKGNLESIIKISISEQSGTKKDKA